MSQSTIHSGWVETIVSGDRTTNACGMAYTGGGSSEQYPPGAPLSLAAFLLLFFKSMMAISARYAGVAGAAIELIEHGQIQVREFFCVIQAPPKSQPVCSTGSCIRLPYPPLPISFFSFMFLSELEPRDYKNERFTGLLTNHVTVRKLRCNHMYPGFRFL